MGGAVSSRAERPEPKCMRRALFKLAHCASTRPDLITRMFQLKVKAILKELIKDGVFGEVAAWMYTIEFQKRTRGFL